MASNIIYIFISLYGLCVRTKEHLLCVPTKELLLASRTQRTSSLCPHSSLAVFATILYNDAHDAQVPQSSLHSSVSLKITKCPSSFGLKITRCQSSPNRVCSKGFSRILKARPGLPPSRALEAIENNEFRICFIDIDALKTIFSYKNQFPKLDLL